jgi:hypothetical protein
MSDILSGNPNNVTQGLSATVSALSNNGSGLVRVTTASPHLFASNDLVVMYTGVVTGTYAITVVGSNTFDLVRSTYSETSTGTVVDISLTPQIFVPTDGDTFSLQLSGMLSSLQALCDRTQFLNSLVNGGQFSYLAYRTSGTWTCPNTTQWVVVMLCGGGGGGAGGLSGAAATAQQSLGGGGGSGAVLVTRVFQVVPGTAYTVTVGSGGAGGSAGNSGSNGNSSFFATIQALGGNGGLSGPSGHPVGSGLLGCALGGDSNVYTNSQPIYDGFGPWTIGSGLGSATSIPIFPAAPSGGGHAFACGSQSVQSWNGITSLAGYAGGSAGAAGNVVSSYYGGGGGGGGGAGGAGNGGSGGGGGQPTVSGTGQVGSAGSSATAATGGGGGGGGGGGSGTSGGSGAAGGNGASGIVVIANIQGYS